MNPSYEQHLHLVSFSVPYPPDYNALVDVYYQIKSFHDTGIKVHLHCFKNGKTQPKELEEICHSIQYYSKASYINALYARVPVSVGARQSNELLSNLSKDDYPVLFQGLHTCFYLNHKQIEHKKKFVRLHNIEWEYLRSLGTEAGNYFRKMYLLFEARKCKEFESLLSFANGIFCISQSDYEYFSSNFTKVHLVPAFHSSDEVKVPEGVGKYAFYHGNLQAVENHKAAMYLIGKVFANSEIPLVIAGKKPSDAIFKWAAKFNNIKIIDSPGKEEMDTLIRDAQVHVLPTFQASGSRQKLISSLFNGRFVITNSMKVKNTGLEILVETADTPEAMIQKVKSLMNKEVSKEMVSFRSEILRNKYSNSKNAQTIANIIFEKLNESKSDVRPLHPENIEQQ